MSNERCVCVVLRLSVRLTPPYGELHRLLWSTGAALRKCKHSIRHLGFHSAALNLEAVSHLSLIAQLLQVGYNDKTILFAGSSLSIFISSVAYSRALPFCWTAAMTTSLRFFISSAGYCRAWPFYPTATMTTSL